MRCPTCSYEFDPTTGLECPRCGEAADCTAVACADCEACTDLLGGLQRLRGGEDQSE
jgi:hypothetical protein